MYFQLLFLRASREYLISYIYKYLLKNDSIESFILEVFNLGICICFFLTYLAVS